VDYLREAQAGEPSFCREFSLSDAPETRMNRGGDFSNIYKRDHFVESVGETGGFAGKRGELHRGYSVRLSLSHFLVFSRVNAAIIRGPLVVIGSYRSSPCAAPN
jgi:hypothetical protein